MTKTLPKIIAGLGVVAGLGVAALPLTSYAATANITVSATVDAVCLEANDVTTGGAGGSLNFGTLVSGVVNAATGGITISGNCGGMYSLSVGTQYDATNDTTAMHLGGVMSDTTNIIAAGTPTVGTTAWGFKVVGSSLGGSTGDIVNDTNYRTATEFSSPAFAGGVTLATGRNISAGAGDSYAITGGLSLAAGTLAQGTYSTTLIFFATE